MVRTTAGDSLGAMADAQRVEAMFGELNAWTNHYNNELLDGKWQHFFNWQPYHWFRSEKIEQPYANPGLVAQTKLAPAPRFLSVSEALSADGVCIESEVEGEVDLWIDALSPIRNFSKAAADNVFCHVSSGNDSFDASATPINNVWHAPYVGPMWSRVGTLHLKKGANRLCLTQLKPDARIDHLYLGLYPPFATEPRVRIPATKFQSSQGNICRIPQLGYTEGVMVGSFDTPSYQQVGEAPYVEYDLALVPGDSKLEVRTLPTLHVYEGRDARFAVQIGDTEPQVFSIHAHDFTAEWRLNVLRGYASRTVSLPTSCLGNQKLRIYLLDPGMVLQEICVHASDY